MRPCPYLGMDWTFAQLLLLALAGMAAGFVNTLAGNGSVFTLSAMLFLGIPADLANATNRVGVVSQGGLAIFNLRDTNHVGKKRILSYIIPSALGAIAGVLVVTELDKEVLEYVIGGVMAFLLVLILSNTKSFISTNKNHLKKPNSTIEFLLLFAVGFYGGFIQAGIGIMLIMTLTLFSNNAILQANFLKLVIIWILTIPVIFIFTFKNQVLWGYGITLASGQGLGAWLASKYAARSPKVGVWMKYLLVCMILISLIKIFFPWEWIENE